MPERPFRQAERERARDAGEPKPVRAFWSGTITFGLVSIPVDFLAAVTPRHKSMKMVDKQGHALGRVYACSKDGKRLDNDEIVRGYETGSGEVVVISDEEFESVAPEISRDITLRSFVPLEQIASVYHQRPYYLAPADRSVKAYNLLAMTMQRAGRVGIGSFVMRGHEYLVAILSRDGVLRAETLRYAEELRTPEELELPPPRKAKAKAIQRFAKQIDALKHDRLDIEEMQDRDAEALRELAQAKLKKREDVIEQAEFEDEDEEAMGGKVVDLVEVLRNSLSKKAAVTTAGESASSRGDGADETRAAARKPARRAAAPRISSARGRRAG